MALYQNDNQVYPPGKIVAGSNDNQSYAWHLYLFGQLDTSIVNIWSKTPVTKLKVLKCPSDNIPVDAPGQPKLSYAYNCNSLGKNLIGVFDPSVGDDNYGSLIGDLRNNKANKSPSKITLIFDYGSQGRASNASTHYMQWLWPAGIYTPGGIHDTDAAHKYGSNWLFWDSHVEWLTPRKIPYFDQRYLYNGKNFSKYW